MIALLVQQALPRGRSQASAAVSSLTNSNYQATRSCATLHFAS